MISKETDPSIKALLVGILLLGLGSICFWLSQNPFAKQEVSIIKTTTPEFFDYGVIYDSLYCNAFFNFKIPLFKEHETHYQTYDLVQKSLIEYDTVPLSIKRPDEIVSVALLHIEPEFDEDIGTFLKKKPPRNDDFLQDFDSYLAEKNKRYFFGADYQLRISCYRLEDETFSGRMAQYENLHNPDYGAPKITSVGGLPFREYRGTDQQQTFFMGMRTKHIISYAREIHGFVFSIDLFYETEEQKCLLLDMVDQLHFEKEPASVM